MATLMGAEMVPVCMALGAGLSKRVCLWLWLPETPSGFSFWVCLNCCWASMFSLGDRILGGVADSFVQSSLEQLLCRGLGTQ